MCVSLVSTIKVKELYDAPLYSLALCKRCLGVLARRIDRTALLVTTEEEPGDDILEEGDDERN